MSKSSNSGGITTVGLLGVVFVTLKLCGVIDWSWWMVTMPFWIGLAIILVAVILMYLFAGIMSLFKSKGW
jgi:hypothetical protein